MEIKINKEIRSYSESVAMGLSLRQFICAALALSLSIVLSVLLKDFVPGGALPWIIILSSAPFAFLGFFTFNGMPFEKAAWCFIRSEILEPRYVKFEGKNLYMEIFKNI